MTFGRRYPHTRARLSSLNLPEEGPEPGARRGPWAAGNQGAVTGLGVRDGSTQLSPGGVCKIRQQMGRSGGEGSRRHSCGRRGPWESKWEPTGGVGPAPSVRPSLREVPPGPKASVRGSVKEEYELGAGGLIALWGPVFLTFAQPPCSWEAQRKKCCQFPEFKAKPKQGFAQILPS